MLHSHPDGALDIKSSLFEFHVDILILKTEKGWQLHNHENIT